MFFTFIHSFIRSLICDLYMIYSDLPIITVFSLTFFVILQQRSAKRVVHFSKGTEQVLCFPTLYKVYVRVRKSVTVFVRIRVVTFTFFGISHGRVNQVVLLNIENHAVQK